jgi:hypothetical protein
VLDWCVGARGMVVVRTESGTAWGWGWGMGGINAPAVGCQRACTFTIMSVFNGLQARY